MSVKDNTIVQTQIPDSAVRAVDFASRFDVGIRVLEELFNNIRMVEHKPGEQLYSRKAAVTLNTSTVAEGDEIPYNTVSWTNVPVGEVALDKQIIAPTVEAVLKSGIAAIQMADDDMIFKMQNKIATNLITFMTTGTLTSPYTTVDFTSAVAEAIGQVSNKWENMNLGYSEIVGFVNTLDLFRNLGANPPTTQKEFGFEYIKSYYGINKLFYSSKVPQGTVLATPAENIIMDYVNFNNPDIARLGFDFTTTGERGLIGVATNPVKNRLVSEMIAVTGVGLRAEYLDGIAKIQIAGVMPELTVKSVAGSASGKTAVTVSGYTLGSGDSYKYKVTDDRIIVTKGDSTSSGWTNWNGSAEITATTGKHITVVVSNSNAVVAAGEDIVTAKA